MIRQATLWDIPECVRLGERFWNESPYGKIMPCDPMEMADLAERLVREGVIFVAKDGMKITGMIGGLPSRHPITGRTTVTEMFWYMAPEHRGQGIRLLRSLEKWARERGIGHSVVADPDGSVGALYGRLGYTKAEEQYIKAL